MERGYFSGRVTLEQRIALRGSARNGQAMLHFSDAQPTAGHRPLLIRAGAPSRS